MNATAMLAPRTKRFNTHLAALGGLAFVCWFLALLGLASGFAIGTAANPERLWLWLAVAATLAAVFATSLGYAKQLGSVTWPLVGVLATVGAWVAFAATQAVWGRSSDVANGAVALSSILFLGLCVRAVLMDGQAAHWREERAISLDPLTGLLTREAFLLRRPNLASSGHALLMLELNDYKAMRRTQGVVSSDARLSQIAKQVAAVLPNSALAARWDNNIFALLLPNHSEQTAAEFTERLQASLPSARKTLPVFAVGVSDATGGPLERALALALERLQLHKEWQREQETRITGVRELSSFDDFSSRLEKLSDPEDIIEIGLRLAAELSGFDGGQYIALEDGRFVLRHICFRRGKIELGVLPLVGKLSFDAGRGLVGQAISTGLPQYASDYASDWRAREDNNLHFIKSILVLPLRRNNRVVALLSLYSNHVWQAITPSVRRTLEALASRLKHALELEDALEKERQTLEHSLAIPGLSLEARDFETSGHTERVVKLAVRLGTALGLRGTELDALRQGAYLHDIGKLAVDNGVILKRGELTPDEWLVIRNHTILGAALVERIPSLPRGAIDVVRYHHERWDGGGYPRGLRGDAIPLVARIFTICDIYDALVSERPYKIAWPEHQAVEELRHLSGRNLDPRVVDVFIDQVLDAAQLN